MAVKLCMIFKALLIYNYSFLSIIKFISNQYFMCIMNNESLLCYIAEHSGLFAQLKTSTLKLAKEFNVSQQTVSRKLIEMEKKGMIKRDASPQGIKICLTQKSFSFLNKKYLMLKKAFEKGRELKGTVKTGMGEGSYYISKYSKRIEKKLGFNPFSGTLNIIVNPIDKKEFLSNMNPVIINGFKTSSRSYGAVHCYNVKINNAKAAIIIPERTAYPENIVELISAVNLKKRFKLKEKSKVTLTK